MMIYDAESIPPVLITVLTFVNGNKDVFVVAVKELSKYVNNSGKGNLANSSRNCSYWRLKPEMCVCVSSMRRKTK